MRVDRYRVLGGPAGPLTEQTPAPPAAGGTPVEASPCRSGCPSQDHASYGDCLRSMRVGISAGETAGAQYG